MGKSEDQRCVVAVDAASVNTKLQIHKDGQVDGLLEELTIDSDIVDLTSTDIDILQSFYEMYHVQIAIYFFCFLCLLFERTKQIISNIH